MRLLHPRTLEIAASRDDIPKTVLSHAYAEVFKFKSGNRSHPKMWIKDDYKLGQYLSLVYWCGIKKGCEFDMEKVRNLSKEIYAGFCWKKTNRIIDDYVAKMYVIDDCDFDDNYLFSDACSLYYKGINIFPDIYGSNWRKYVPVESHKEILRQLTKTLNK